MLRERAKMNNSINLIQYVNLNSTHTRLATDCNVCVVNALWIWNQREENLESEGNYEQFGIIIACMKNYFSFEDKIFSMCKKNIFNLIKFNRNET